MTIVLRAMTLWNIKYISITYAILCFIFVISLCQGLLAASNNHRLPRKAEDITPFFDNSTNRNITTTSGKTAYLPCRVRHLGDRTVSWIRKKDLHVLTVGKFTYTNDQRFQTLHLENSDDWTLQVRYPLNRDAGVYECQVSTVPKMSLFVNLDVIVSKADIQGGPTLYINSGSTLTLTCIVVESPVPPVYVFWYHNGHPINYETPRGITVDTKKDGITTSKLQVPSAQTSDSGTYSCVPSNAEPADIIVHVLNGENPAAMQHGKHPSSVFRTLSCTFLTCLVPIFVILWTNKR